MRVYAFVCVCCSIFPSYLREPLFFLCDRVVLGVVPAQIFIQHCCGLASLGVCSICVFVLYCLPLFLSVACQVAVLLIFIYLFSICVLSVLYLFSLHSVCLLSVSLCFCFSLPGCLRSPLLVQ